MGKGLEEIPPKKIYIQLISTCKDAQHYQPLRKCKSKPQWDTTPYPLGWLLLKKRKIKSVVQDVEKLEPVCIAGESVKWCSRCRKVWQFLKNLNIEYDPEIHFCVYAQNMKANRCLYTNVHSSTIHNSQKVETIHMSICR